MKKLITIKFALLAIFAGLFLTASIQAATFTVNSTADPGDGTCDTTECTLREAIAVANGAAGDDVIEFDATVFSTSQKIELTAGELVIANKGSLTINGTTANQLSVSGNKAGRVFFISDGANATINFITVTDGNGVGALLSGYGGGIYNRATLKMNNSTVRNNSATYGGGILNRGTTTLNNSTVSGNSANAGGGIFINSDVTTTLINSTVIGNSATDYGGGIFNSGTTRLNNSTVSGNSATNGGGISNYSTTTLNNSTVSFNLASSNGGGIFNGGATTLNNSTVSVNKASSNGGGIFNGGTTTLNNSTVSVNSASNTGGGIFNDFRTTLNNSIIANSTSGGDCFSGGTFDASYSLIEDGTCGVTNGVNNNKTGDPKLGRLQNNGGPTQTHALLPGSKAIDAGSNALIPAGITTDQRGENRIIDGDSNGTATVDMGSFEAPNLFLVNSTADPGDGTCDATECTLREAVAATNRTAGDDVINFDPTVFSTPRKITLTAGELVIANNGSLTINGTGAHAQLSVSGNNASRVFFISDGANATINFITITDGNGVGAAFSGRGGGIFNNGGKTTLNYSTVSGNLTGAGGGIFNDDGGTTTLINSTVSGNTATNYGGGIFNRGTTRLNNSTVSGNSSNAGGGIFINSGGTTTLNNSTVSGNSAKSGGGIFNGGTTKLNNSTVSRNSASSIGGGIYNSGTTTLNNSIIANIGEGDCFSGGTFDASYSLIEDGTCGVTNGVNNNKTGDPKLGRLQNNGGPTQTHALLPGSKAIDAGSNALIPATIDQRGQNRIIDGNSNGTATVDMGSFEAPNLFLVNSTADPGDGTCDATECTLREAIDAANATADADPGDGTCDATECTLREAIDAANATADDVVIEFDPTVFSTPQTIKLTAGELIIANNGSLTINGTTANQLSVSGNNASRVFSISNGANATINAITITGGNGVGAFNSGLGGGIFNQNSGIITLNNSTVSNNSGSQGGGIVNSNGGTITLNNSTVSGNSAFIGGGIYNNGTTTLNNSTLSGNSAGNYGGGIFNEGATTLNNSIIANSISNGDCFSTGTFNASFSLIEDGDCGVNNGVNGNLTGDPNLGPLQNNGGETQTHALLPGSKAIDAGSNALIPAGITTDQRGENLIIDGDNNGSAIVDMGSFEALAPTAASVSISGRVSNGRRGLARATVYLTDQSGDTRTARTNPFGFYRFTDVEVGQSLIVNVFDKRYQFIPQVVTINNAVENLDFIAQPSAPASKTKGLDYLFDRKFN